MKERTAFLVDQLLLVREFRECFRRSKSETCAYARAVYHSAADELFHEINEQFKGSMESYSKRR